MTTTIETAVEAEVQRRLAEALNAAALVPTVFTVNEAAEKLRVSRSTVYQLIADGELVPSRVSRKVLIPASEVARLLALRGPVPEQSRNPGKSPFGVSA